MKIERRKEDEKQKGKQKISHAHAEKSSWKGKRIEDNKQKQKLNESAESVICTYNASKVVAKPFKSFVGTRSNKFPSKRKF